MWLEWSWWRNLPSMTHYSNRTTPRTTRAIPMYFMARESNVTLTSNPPPSLLTPTYLLIMGVRLMRMPYWLSCIRLCDLFIMRRVLSSNISWITLFCDETGEKLESLVYVEKMEIQTFQASSP